MSPASLEGQTLGKYRVMEPLGRGGMARVYRAYHPQLDRYVAIKVLRSDLVEDEEFLVRFRREARAIASLRHSNVVQVYDSDVEGEIYYIVLELLEGDSLKTRLNDYRVRDERMPLGDMVRVLIDVLEGLAYAHSEGMIHRDIKPANIMLTKRGEAVLTDFGIAQILGSTSHTASGAMMGTLNYMAPEQGLQGQSDARSDIYSLGIVFYEMLTKRVPFDADTPLAVLMKHLNDPLPLPRKIEPAVPEALERVVLKALAKQPDDRYQSAEEMKKALAAAAQEAEIDIPQSISLPLSFTTPEAPAESVAVFSGTARKRITDVHFADDDTDASVGKRLAEASAEAGRSLGAAGKELWKALGGVAHVALTKTTDALRDVTSEIEKGKEAPPEGEGLTAPEPPSPSEPPDMPKPPAAMGAVADEAAVGAKSKKASKRANKRETRRIERETRKLEREKREPSKGLGLTILGALGIVFAGNTCMLTMAVPFDWWEIYEMGWPIELFFVALGLFAIMYATSSIWMLIPAGIVFGTGLLMTYSALSNEWNAWAFMWLCQAWVVIGAVGVPIWLARNKRLARGTSRLISLVGGLLSIGMMILIAAVLGAVGLLDSLAQMLGLM